MRETIELVVKALVDDGDSVDVREIDREGTTRIEVRVAQPDMGKVIGKQGGPFAPCAHLFMPPG
jgi:predicted RNA-binding protein YlqC (UPF0109 family)